MDFYSDIRIRDIFQKTNDSFDGCKVLHISIPYISREQFEDAVCGAIDAIKSSVPSLLVLVHTTTPPGATKRLADRVAGQGHKCEIHIAHVPVRGTHPNLHDGIKKHYVNNVGGVNPRASMLIANHLKAQGCPARECPNPETTEVCKILSTTYFGVCLAWHAEVQKVCDAFGIDYAQVIEWNKEYNSGITNSGRAHLCRPIIQRLKLPFGGHCVGPNAWNLLKLFPDLTSLQLVTQYCEKKLHVTVGKTTEEMKSILKG